MEFVNWIAWWAKKNRVHCIALLSAMNSLACSSLASGGDMAPDSRWTCLTQDPVPLTTPSPAPTAVVFVVPIFDFANPPSEVPGLSVAVCQSSDVECPVEKQAGIVTGPVPTKTTLQGAAITVPLYTLLMQYGTPAYVRLTAPGYIRQEYNFAGPMIGARSGAVTPLPDGSMAPLVQGFPFLMVKESDATSLSEGIGQPRDPADALTAVRAIDCDGNPASGVTLKLTGAKGVAFSFLNNRPLSQNPVTDITGLAGFTNIPLPTGTTTFNVTIEATNSYGVSYGLTPFLIRANQLSSGEIRPFPTLFGR